MALQTFETRILDFLGEALTTGDLSLDAEMIDDWLTNGAKEVISKLPKRFWWTCSSATSLTDGNGAAIGTDKIDYVVRSDSTINQRCRFVPASLEGRITDSNDVDYATTTDPVYFKKNGKIYVKPDPTASQASTINAVSFPTIDASVDTSISNFPNDLEECVVTYTLSLAKLRESAIMRRNAQTEIKAIISSGILNNLSTTYTDIETALDLIKTNLAASSISTALNAVTTAFGRINSAVGEASTEHDKIVTAINTADSKVDDVFTATTGVLDLANTEFDKINALLNLGETDSEGDVNTALTAMKTALGKVAGIIVEGSNEIDSGSSELDAIFTGGTDGMFDDFDTAIADVQTDLDNAISILGTTASAANSVSDILVAASATSPADVDAIQHISDEDIELADASVNLGVARMREADSVVNGAMGKIKEASAELDNIASHINALKLYFDNAFSYFKEAESYLAEATGHGNEIITRLKQAEAKRREGEARKSSGSAYLLEAQERVNAALAYIKEADARLDNGSAYLKEAQMAVSEGNSYIAEAKVRMDHAVATSNEVAGRVEKARVYLDECNIRLGTANDFNNKNTLALNDYKILQEKFNHDLEMFISQ